MIWRIHPGPFPKMDIKSWDKLSGAIAAVNIYLIHLNFWYKNVVEKTPIILLTHSSFLHFASSLRSCSRSNIGKMWWWDHGGLLLMGPRPSVIQDACFPVEECKGSTKTPCAQCTERMKGGRPQRHYHNSGQERLGRNK